MGDSKKVLVYLIADPSVKDNERKRRVETLAKLFTGTKSLPISFISREVIDHGRPEKQILGEVLAEASKTDRNAYVIYLKDSSVSSGDSESVAVVIKSAIAAMERDDKSNSQKQLVYLGSWLNRCELDTEFAGIERYGTVFLNSQSPNGVQALLISPSGRDMLLGKSTSVNGNMISLDEDVSKSLNGLVTSGDLASLTVSPPIFQYDITVAANSSRDFDKLRFCAGTSAAATNSSSSSTGKSFWIFLLIIIIILALAFFLIRIDRKYDTQVNLNRKPRNSGFSSK